MEDLPGLYSISIGSARLWPPHPSFVVGETFRTLEEAQADVGDDLRWVHGQSGDEHYWDADLDGRRKVRIHEALGIVGVDTSTWPRASARLDG